MESIDFKKFEKFTGIAFEDITLLTQAFTHRSYLNENPGIETGHNERLEFLGDAVLELVVTEFLYAQYPDKPEGELTNFRAALVNADMLSKIAQTLGFNNFILLSRGEAKDTGRARAYILANAFEAVVGAVYLDQGYEVVKSFIHKSLLPNIEEIIEHKLWKDPKSAFQEAAQERVGVTPTYRVVEETGPDHNKKFVVGVYIEREMVAKGDGSSKQDAEVKAAQAALANKGW